MTFSSVYEMTNPLTTVRKQHFWDWFSGDDLHNRWTKRDNSGTGVFNMVDAVDEGFSITTGAAATNNRSRIDHNNKRWVAHNGSELIAVVRRVTTTNMICQVGLHGDANTSPTEIAVYRDQTSNTNKVLFNGDATSTTSTDSSIVVDENYTNVKIQLTSSSAKMTLAGVLEATSTTNLPDSKMQPAFESRNITSAGAKECRIRYFEAYNT